MEQQGFDIGIRLEISKPPMSGKKCSRKVKEPVLGAAEPLRFRLVPERFEFWQGREDRLHDRFEFLPTEEAGLWDINRLDP